MANTIRIGTFEVSSFKVGVKDPKIYLGDILLYPTGGYKVCYAVVDDISQYSETEFEDVYDKATEKWFKLNNLNQYEQYGVYGSGRNITYYDGKLTIDDGYEYQYSGGSWVNIGEVSGGTATLPDVPFTLNYNAKNYDASTHVITKTSGQLNNIDAVITGTTSSISDYSSDGYIRLTGSSSTPLRARVSNSSVNGYFNRSNTNPNLTIIAKILTQNSNTADDVLVNRESYSNYNWMYRHKPSLVTLHGSSEQGSIAVSNTVPNICSARVASNRLLTYNNWTQNTTSTYSNFNYGRTTSDGGALFCSYTTYNELFWKGDFYWIYMSQNTLTDEQVQQVIAYNESGGGESEYPKYYDEIQDPPDNLVFSSMAEAEAYECPWVGMKATIDGDKYVFSGDSVSGYEWVYNPSRLPQGYTEVEYIESTNRISNTQSTTRFNVLGDNTSGNTYTFVYELPSDAYSASYYAYLFGNNSVYYFKLDNGWGSQKLEINYFGRASGTSPYTPVGTKVEMVVTKDNITITDVQTSSSQTYNYTSSRSYTSVDRFGIFCIYNKNDAYCSTGKIYELKIESINGVVLNDYIPATRDSDMKVGLYDIVGNAFYYDESGTLTIVAGDPV